MGRAESLGKQLSPASIGGPIPSPTPPHAAPEERQRLAQIKFRRAKSEHEVGRFWAAKDLYLECAQEYISLAQQASDPAQRQGFHTQATSVLALVERIRAATATAPEPMAPVAPAVMQAIARQTSPRKSYC